MKTSRLITALVAVAVASLIAADASAMYNPATGTFLQRDPGGVGAVRLGGGGSLPSAEFVPRDPSGQYADGMNLYQYVRSQPTRMTDPLGLQSAPSTCCCCVIGLRVIIWGPIHGEYGISDYWPVTKYWGDDKTLGEFRENGLIGHKFQVIGESSTKDGKGCKFVQMARITSSKGGTPTAWFDDMHYTDSGGVVHNWNPNAEAGSTTSEGPGVGRLIEDYHWAYTDPPAVPSTGTRYRKLEHDITYESESGCKCSISKMGMSLVQEIEVKDGRVVTSSFKFP